MAAALRKIVDISLVERTIFWGTIFFEGFLVSHLDVGIFGTYPNWSQFGPCIGSFRRSRGTCWILPIFPVFRAGCNIVPLLFCRPWLCPFTHTGGGAFSENEPLRARREENFPNFPLDVFFCCCLFLTVYYRTREILRPSVFSSLVKLYSHFRSQHPRLKVERNQVGTLWPVKSPCTSSKLATARNFHAEFPRNFM